jgi:hypothetical protein
MKSYTYRYLDLNELCEYNDLDYVVVMEAISNSDISFGTNYDTLISVHQLESILVDAEVHIEGLDYNNHDIDGEIILISLGS